MQRIAFYVNSEKPEASAVRDRLAAFARTVGLTVLDAGGGACDAVIVLGGDGTMLSAVHRFPGIPLLGLNLGSLGYLAGVEAPHFEDALRALRNDAFTLSRRTAITVMGHTALNDVVFSRGTSGHAAVIALSVDGRTATRFFADGLVEPGATGLIDEADLLFGHVAVMDDVAAGTLGDGDDEVGLADGAAELPGVDMGVDPGVVFGMTEEDEVVDGDDTGDAALTDADG